MPQGRAPSSSQRIRNYSYHHRAPRLTAASRPKIPRPLNQAQRADQNAATDQAIAARSLEHSHLPTDPPGSSSLQAAFDFGDSIGGAGEHWDAEGDSDREALDVLNGDSIVDASHAGGEIRVMLERLQAEAAESAPKRKDLRNRRDRQKRRIAAFDSQMNPMVDSFMAWWKDLGERGLASADPRQVLRDEPVLKCRQVQVLDVYSTYAYDIGIVASDLLPSCSAILHGLIPSAPFDPSYAISIRALELFRTTHLRCPHLTIEAFLKGLCDLYGMQYRKALQRVFSACYDLYLQLRRETDKRVLEVLGRTGNWRRKNACPACTYQLKDEEPLLFSILVTMDGNNSLKRILRKALDSSFGGDEANHGVDHEDDREVECDLYLPREAVEKFQRAKGTEAEMREGSQGGKGGKGKQKKAAVQTKGREENDMRTQEDADDPCASRWKNMKEDSTERMWKLFDETGIFLCLCRHGFALAVADMVQSGELSKYPLAAVEALLDAFGNDIGAGYDIGCKFGTTLAQSPLGPRAKAANFTPLVGSFHGHAHNRLCQLSHLAVYVLGIGLEDLEGCERFFSKSNALANAVRYASAFHRRQAIDEYIKHVDRFETAQSLSKFLVENYNQAQTILNGEASLREAIAAQGISDPKTTFPQWLVAERQYLQGLTTEPIEETVQMEYYQSLVDWKACEAYEKEFKTATAFVQCDPSQPKGASATGATVARRRAATENSKKALARVQEYELHLEVTERWSETNPDYIKAAELVRCRRYRRCLDELEGLVVARIFELTKMNMSQTGYKLRRHIAHSLQARSQGIKAALKRYNEAARAFKPARPSLTWEEVVDYAFLSDFDLLRDARQDIRQKPWAQPTNRKLMNQWFKLDRAREEIQRLHVEIRRVVTYMQDEENYLLATEDELQESSPVLAFHVRRYRLDQTRFFALHRRRFSALPKLPPLVTALTPGISRDPTLRTKTPTLHPSPMDVDQEDIERVPTTGAPLPTLETPASPQSSAWKDPDQSSEDESENEGGGKLGEEAYLEARFQVLQVSHS